MGSFAAVLFTAHVHAVTCFENHKKRQRGKSQKSNNEFPHDACLQWFEFVPLQRDCQRNLALENLSQAYKLPSDLPMLMRGSD